MQRLVRELDRVLLTHGLTPVSFEELGFVHDSYVHHGDPPSVPAGRIRTGGDSIELLASLVERNPRWIHADFIMTHEGHRIVALRAEGDRGETADVEGMSINVSIEGDRYDLTDDEDRPIVYDESGQLDSSLVVGTMEELKLGERVVDLGNLCTTGAALSGALTAAVGVAWVLDMAWMIVAAACVAGGAVGFVAGKIAGRGYRTGGGYASVVRVGRASLGATLRAALSGSLAAAALTVILVTVGFGAVGEVPQLLGIGLGVGIAAGGALGCLSALV